MARQVSLFFLHHLVRYHLIMAAEAAEAVEQAEQILPAEDPDPQMAPMQIPAVQVKPEHLPKREPADPVGDHLALAALAEIGEQLATMVADPTILDLVAQQVSQYKDGLW